MSAQGRSGVYPAYVHGNGPQSGGGQSHLIKSVRHGASQMAEYYHSTMVANGRTSPPTKDSEGNYYPAGRRIPSMEDPMQAKEEPQQFAGHSSNGNGAAAMGLPSGHFMATPIKVEEKYDGRYDDTQATSRTGPGVEVRPALAQESRASTATRVQLSRNQDQLGTPTGSSRSQFWRDGVPDDKRTRVGGPGSPHRRHNTSPDNKYFISAQGSGGGTALTVDNVRSLGRGERTQLRRSNSNSTLNELNDRLEHHLHHGGVASGGGGLLPRREYGSTSSIDVQSLSGESFFQMLQDYRADTDQRSPAPPQFNRLLQGRVGGSTTLFAGAEKPIPSRQQQPLPPPPPLAADKATKEPPAAAAKEAADSADYGGSPKMTRKQSKRHKKNRTKSVSGADQSFFKKKLRGSVKAGDRGEALDKAGRGTGTAGGEEEDLSLEDKIEERTRQLAFQHYDVQSTYFDMQDVIRNKKLTKRKRNTTTGASAASRHSASNTPEGSLEDLLKVDPLNDDGDGRGNLLVHSCPFFRNEIGDEVEPRVSFSRIGMLNARAMHRERHRAVLETEVEERRGPASWKGPVIEFVDHGAMYYRKYFYGFEHQNFFGLDETYGPVAVSVRREVRTEDTEGGSDSKDKEYLYRVIIRSSELVTLRGVIAEESIPSTAKHNSPKGLPLRDVLEYVAPDLPLACLRLAITSAKVTEQLLKLDEQGVITKYKVGIMLCRTGQSTEEEMYNNELSTPAFDEFLDCIGEKIRLKGFDRYRAQLDNKTDSTGTHSVYATYQGHEIMFHVSTMLPFTANNRQQLLRKRHIGNDIVTIVFQEPGAEPFTPKTVRSQFQHVFVVVRALDPNTDNAFYSVAVTRAKDVASFGPPLPSNATFPKGPAFTEFLLAKLINAENVVHKSEKFMAMATRTKSEYLKDLAEHSVTATTVDSGAKSSKFILSHKKKEKVCPRPAPDFQGKGALVWRVEVFLWSPIWTDKDVQVEEFSLSDPVECICAVSPDLFTLVRDSVREVIFSIPCKAIIGWTDSQRNLKLYFNEGNCVRVRIPDEELDEIPEMVKRLEAVSTGVKTQEITLLRNGLGQLGFHVHYQGIVVEVDPYGWAWQAGLRKGARLVEICEIAVCTQTHEEMIDLLRTSQTVKVLVVPPHDDGSPRRGSTPIDYDASLPHAGKTSFNRTTSTGKGGHSYRAPITITRDGKPGQGAHSRSATMPPASSTLPPSHTRTPSDASRSTDELDGSASSAVRSAIATLERRIHHHQPDGRPAGQSHGQHRYRATVNYWKEVNHANRMGLREPGPPPAATGQHGGTLDSRSSRDSGSSSGGGGGEAAFSRLAGERRSSRDMPRLQAGLLHGSQEELEQIAAGLAARPPGSQEELRQPAAGGHSRQSSVDDKLDPYQRARVFSDSSKSGWQRPPRHQQSATFPESNQGRSAFTASSIHYRGASSMKHSRSGEPISSSNSEEKWYDTHDDLNGYHDSRPPRSRENVVEPSYGGAVGTTATTAAAAATTILPGHPALADGYREPELYGKPERYSPTEHLYPDSLPTPESELQQQQQVQQQRTGRPAPISSNLVLPAPSSSNLSDMSLHSHSTHSSGSSQRGDYRELGGGLHGHSSSGGNSLPRNPMPARSPELSRRSTVHGAPVQARGEYAPSGHRRTGPSASSSSSISESSSPRVTRRRTTEVRSSNDSLNTRLRQGLSGTKSLPASNQVQESLRRLIAPDSLPVDPSAAVPRAAQAAVPQEQAQTSRPAPLHRTYSDESIAAGGGPYNRPACREAFDLDLSNNDVLFTSTKASQLENEQLLVDNQPHKAVRFAARQPLRTINQRRYNTGRSSEDVNANNNQGGSNPPVFPLPDSAAHLDWSNLVETANAFQDIGSDQQGIKSASTNKLNDFREAAAQQAFQHAGAAGPSALDKKKQLSQSTDALSPSTARRARPHHKGSDYDTPSLSASYDASSMKRSANQLEVELRRTQERLAMERRQKEDLAGQVSKLLNDNKRLQGESASTAEQLQQFTDWFFNAIEK